MQSHSRTSGIGTKYSCTHPTGAFATTPVPPVMPNHDRYTTLSQNMFHPQAANPLQSPNTKSEAIHPSFINSINMTGRLFTSLDACASDKWDIHPAIQLRYALMPQEYRDIFDHCKPHHQIQSALIEFLEWVRLNPGRTPPSELLHGLCRNVPAENPKKRWACGMKGCQKVGDTLEHLRSHLQGRAHFNFQFFRCDFCSSAFHLKHDKDRHVRTKHGEHQVDEQEEDDQEDGDFKTGVRRARSKTRKVRKETSNAPISGRRSKTHSSSPEQKRVSRPYHEAVHPPTEQSSRKLLELASPPLPPAPSFLDQSGPIMHSTLPLRTTRSSIPRSPGIPTRTGLQSPYANERLQIMPSSTTSTISDPTAYPQRLGTNPVPLNQKPQSSPPMYKIQDMSLPETDPDYEFLANYSVHSPNHNSRPMPQATTNQTISTASMSYMPATIPTVSNTASSQYNISGVHHRTTYNVSAPSSSHENRNMPSSQISVPSLSLPAVETTSRRLGRSSKTKGSHPYAHPYWSQP